MSQITSHVLDLSVGRPAAGVPLSLFKLDAIDQSKVTETIGRGVTNEDGRATDLVETNIVLEKGSYKLHFNLSSYFKGRGIKIFFPSADIIFVIEGTGEHYHIPLLLSPYGYSTYRGS